MEVYKNLLTMLVIANLIWQLYFLRLVFKKEGLNDIERTIHNSVSIIFFTGMICEILFIVFK